MSHRRTITEFIEISNKVHKNKYDYSKTLYPKSNKIKCIIRCPIHGDFLQRPNDHICGYGCKKCGNIRKSTLNFEDFLKNANNIHKSEYTYIPKIISKLSDKVEIICKIHGIFVQTIDHHIRRKQGCRKCKMIIRNQSNWVPNKRKDWTGKYKDRTCRFYIIKCFNSNECFIKMGITSKEVTIRFAPKDKMPYSYIIVSEILGTSEEVWDLEILMSKKYTSYKYLPKVNFAGSGECYSLDLLNIIKNENFRSIC